MLQHLFRNTQALIRVMGFRHDTEWKTKQVGDKNEHNKRQAERHEWLHPIKRHRATDKVVHEIDSPFEKVLHLRRVVHRQISNRQSSNDKRYDYRNQKRSPRSYVNLKRSKLPYGKFMHVKFSPLSL